MPLPAPRVWFPAAVAAGLLAYCIPTGGAETAAPAKVAEPAGYRETARAFFDQFCMNCHGPKSAKAGLRLDELGTDFTAAGTAEHWKELLDRVNAGEMPPKNSPRPSAQQVAAFSAWVTGELRKADLAAKNAGGRIPMRRLNRDEYANTVRDLLKLDENVVRALVEELPGDGKAEGFDRLGAALFFDQTQIERSLEVAEKLAARAVVTEPPKTTRKLDKFPFLKAPPTVKAYPESSHMIPRGAEEFFRRPGHVEFIQAYPVYHAGYRGTWGSVNHFGIADVVKQDGYYRIRVKAKVDNRGRTEKNRFTLVYALDSPIQVIKEVEVDPSGTTDVVLFLRGPVNGEVKGPQVFSLWWNHTDKAVVMEPKYSEVFWRRVALAGKLEQAVSKRAPASEQAALRKQLDEAIQTLNTWKGQAFIYNPDLPTEKLPRLLVESIEVEGPVQKEWPPASHKSLLFADDSRQDAGYAREVFTRFLPRAYRRPVTPEEVEGVVAVVTEAQKNGRSFPEAIRVGVQRVLCSTGFLFIQEPAGTSPQARPLTDHELASRLSYFLWSTMPDDELLSLAAAGKLRDPSAVAAQVKRMLADSKADQFVRNFAGQWLSVREYGSVQPAAEYRDYDKALEAASKEEPFVFFTEVLQQNLPVTAFIDSDFVVVNERLAKHYGLRGVKGPEFRRVAVKPEDHRGGVLGMCGLMTFLADGTRTLPMRRGTWVLRELFNDPPNNPPPNAGEIQPNTAGKSLTVRQRLELHRRDDVCASCHAKLDPYGLALENYDAIGKWRVRANGEGFRGNNAPVLDVSGALPDGTAFKTLDEYKAGLMKQKDRFARAFATKLLTYALGRPVGYADRGTVDELVAALKKDEYRMQALVYAVVASEPFRTK